MSEHPGPNAAISGGARAWTALVAAARGVLDAGSFHGSDPKERGGIRLVNRVALFVAALLVPYGALFAFIGERGNAAIQLVGISALIGVVGLNRVGWCGWARLVTLLIGDALVFAMTIRLGLDAGAHLYMFAAIIAPLLFYPGRDWARIGPLVSGTLAGSLLADAWAATHVPESPLPDALLPWFHWASLVGSLVTVFAFVLYFYVELDAFGASLVKAHREVSDLAETDGLTGVANRRKLEHVLAAEWARAARGKHALTVVMVDVDHFKRYNDGYGHPSGDLVLRGVAAALQSALLRPSDLVGRYGGEEFLLILAGTELEGGIRVGERARERVVGLAVPHAFGGVDGQVTCSLGVASAWPERGGDVLDLVRRADGALYAAKERGRNRVVAAEEVSG